MNLTYEDKKGIFSVAGVSEYNGYLPSEANRALEKIYDSCSPEEQEELKHTNYSICEIILKVKQERADWLEEEIEWNK